MLQLIANGQTLDITNVTFNLTLRSPILGGNTGSYVYTFSIPYSDVNAEIFGFPFRLNRMDVSNVSLPGQIKYNGLLVQDGSWKANNSMAKTISIEMLIGAGSFSDTIDDTTLPDLFDETFTFPSIIEHAEEQVTKTWPEVNHNFPSIYNPDFYGEANGQFFGVINDFEGSFKQTTENSNTISPQLYLLYIIKKIYAQAGYTVSGDPFEDDMFQRAIIYNNYALDKIVSTNFHGEFNDDATTPAEFFRIIWDDNIFDPGEHYDGNGYYNVASEGLYTIDIDLLHRPVSSPLSPYYYRIEVFYGSTMIYEYQSPNNPGTSNHHNTIHVEHTVESSETGSGFSVNLEYTDGNDQWVIAYSVESSIDIANVDAPETNTYENSIAYKNHVPAFDTKEFLNQFFATVEMLPFFNEKAKTIEFKYFKNLLQQNKQVDLSDGLVEDTLKVYANDYNGIQFDFNWQGPDELLTNNFEQPEVKAKVRLFSDLPFNAVIGEVYYVESLNAYYTLKNHEEAQTITWEAYGDNHLPVVDGNGERQISTQLCPMLMRNVTGQQAAYRSMPSIQAGGTSVAFGISNEFPIRVMFWYGMEYEGTESAYPYAGTTKYRSWGDEFMATGWDWDELIVYYWQILISWYKNRMYVEFTNVVKPEFIANLNFNNKFFFQKTLILLAEAYTPVSNELFGPTKIKAWTTNFKGTDIATNYRAYVNQDEDYYTNEDSNIYIP